MGEINKNDLKSIQTPSKVSMVLDAEGRPTGVYKGPWLDKYYDNYTECLYANINYRRNQIHKEKGLNEFAQTPEQEKAFKERQREAKIKKEKAAVAVEMVAQTK